MILLCRVVLTGVCNELFLLFCIVQGNISTFSCTDADGIFNGYDEDTSVTDLAGMSSLENGMNGLSTFFSRTTMETRILSMELVS